MEDILYSSLELRADDTGEEEKRMEVEEPGTTYQEAESSSGLTDQPELLSISGATITSPGTSGSETEGAAAQVEEKPGDKPSTATEGWSFKENVSTNRNFMWFTQKPSLKILYIRCYNKMKENQFEQWFVTN